MSVFHTKNLKSSKHVTYIHNLVDYKDVKEVLKESDIRDSSLTRKKNILGINVIFILEEIYAELNNLETSKI